MSDIVVEILDYDDLGGTLRDLGVGYDTEHPHGVDREALVGETPGGDRVFIRLLQP